MRETCVSIKSLIRVEKRLATNQTTSGADPNSAQSMFNDSSKEIVHEETVVFHEDGETTTTSGGEPFDSSFAIGAVDTLENSVKGFLARPVLITDFNWDLADLPMKQKALELFPSKWFTRTMIKEKIAGFRYFRGTLVVRLQVNAQPFNAGRLLMVWSPMYNSQSIIPTNEGHLGGLTGYRHVDLDVAQVTAVTMRIPYVSPLTHVDLVTGAGEMGAINIVVYSSLTGADHVEASLWAHFEDVSLEMPTGKPLHNYTSLNTSRIFNAQAGAVPAKETKKESTKGNFQNLFEAQKAVASQMGSIPVIGPIFEGLGWLADAAAGVAGMFGWSKPTDPNFDTGVSPRYMRNFTNFNGSTLARPLGLDARNAIVQPAGTFGTQDDEMALSALVSKPVFVDSFKMTTEYAPGTNIWKWPVHPTSCRRVTAPPFPLDVTSAETYLSYLSWLFKFWRGAIEYHFKLVKTPYHSGRLRFYFVPGAVWTDNPSTFDKDKCYSQVIDLRDTTDFAFSVPFVSNLFWEDVRDPGAFPVAEPSLTKPTGMIYCDVLNTLRNGGASAPTIECLVETCGGSDFQFAYFTKDPRVLPIDAVARPTFVAQAAEPFFDKPDVQGFNANSLTMGEAIVSLRQILKRVTRMWETPLPKPTVAGEAMSFNVLQTYDNTSPTKQVNDVMSYVSMLYRFVSGSIRITVTPSDTKYLMDTVDTYYIKPYTGQETTGFYSAKHDLESMGAPVGKVLSSMEGPVDFDIPWYQQTPMTMTGVGLPSLGSVEASPPSKVFANRGNIFQLLNSEPRYVSRSVGEDFGFGYIIGPPMTVVPLTPTSEE